MSVMVREEPLFKRLLNSPKLFLYQSELRDILSQEQQKRDAFYQWITEDTRTEFINGERVMQSPAKHRHTMASVNLTALLGTYVDIHEMGVVGAETMLVTLTRNDYLPDICFFRKEISVEIISDQMKYPAPDFIVEILSPSTEHIDRGTKFEDYAAHGVEEYWLVNPEERTVEQYRLAQNAYHLQATVTEGEISSIAVDGFTIPVEAIFDKQAKNRVLGLFFTNVA